jgi:hypothetical protein
MRRFLPDSPKPLEKRIILFLPYLLNCRILGADVVKS